MATYVVLWNFTEQGIRNFKDSPNRLTAARSMVRDLGGEIQDHYLTMGAHDAISIIKAPDDKALAKIVLKIGSAGNVRSTTLTTLSEEDYRDIAQFVA